MTALLSRAIRPVVDSLECRCLMAAGQLDPAFGTGGIVRTGVRGDLSNLQVAIGAGGSMLTSGYDVRGGSGATTVVRLTDPTGLAGRDLMTYPITLAGVRDLGFTGDGNVFVAGTNRVNNTGFIDVFAAGGQYLTRLTAGSSISAATKSVDGDFYATGSFVDPADKGIKNGIARLNPDGTFDKTFDGDGIAFTTLTTVNDIFAQPNGAGVIVAGGEGDKSILRRYLPIGLAAEDVYNSTTPAINPVITRDGHMVFQTVTSDGGTEVRASSSTDFNGTPYAGDSLSSRAAGAPMALAANKEGVVSVTLTPGDSAGNVTVKQFDRFGDKPVLQSIVTFPGANIGLAAGVSGDKLTISRVLASPDGSVVITEARVDLQPAVTPVVGRATVAGVVFTDENESTYREDNEVAAANRTVFVDANNNGKYDAGEKYATTDAGGYYEFTGLVTGTYTVRQIVPDGMKATNYENGQVATVATNDAYTFLADFGTRTPLVVGAPGNAPAAVKGTKAALMTKGKTKTVRLTWTDAKSIATGYRIERRYRGETTWAGIATLGAKAMTYDDASVLKGVVYEYRIVAINAAGSTAGNVVSVKT